MRSRRRGAGGEHRSEIGIDYYRDNAQSAQQSKQDASRSLWKTHTLKHTSRLRPLDATVKPECAADGVAREESTDLRLE